MDDFWKEAKLLYKCHGIHGVLLRGHVEVKNLSCNGKYVEATLRSPINQKVELQLPNLIEKLSSKAKLRAYPAHPNSYHLTLPTNKNVHLEPV